MVENMKRQEELSRELTELITATKEGKIRWNLQVQTTEANDAAEKPVERENGVEWTIDECYVSYYCEYKGKEFCMITYEMIKTAGEKVTSGNMVFCPPLGVRFFDLRTLMPYSVETSAVFARTDSSALGSLARYVQSRQRRHLSGCTSGNTYHRGLENAEGIPQESNLRDVLIFLILLIFRTLLSIL